MAWEREFHHVDLDKSQHLISLVDRGVPNIKGEPTRYLIQVEIGNGGFDYVVGKRKVHIMLGGDFTVDAYGTIHDSAGAVFDIKDFEMTMLRKLTEHHRNLRAYAKKHGAPEYKGPRR
jgi:hypothetical protein